MALPATFLHSRAQNITLNSAGSQANAPRPAPAPAGHAGLRTSTGCCAPEIDSFKIEKDKANLTRQVASQSAQFAPLTRNYVYLNDTQVEFVIHNTSIARPNTYHGSAVQQAVRSLSMAPEDMFQGSGDDVFHTMAAVTLFSFLWGEGADLVGQASSSGQTWGTG